MAPSASTKLESSNRMELILILIAASVHNPAFPQDFLFIFA